MPSALVIVLTVASSLWGQAGETTKREKIGEVYCKPVYRDEIHADKNEPRSGELLRLFAAPVMEKYRVEHDKEITPTPAEIDAVTKYLREQHAIRIKDTQADLQKHLAQVEEKLSSGTLTENAQAEMRIQQQVLKVQLDPPHRSVAKFMLGNWKLQRHLYDNYGGGRILWQQAGLEAFDATRKWLESREAAGDFSITDPKLRAEFYEYWTTHNHGAFLVTDPERIRNEFLEPEWLPKVPQP